MSKNKDNQFINQLNDQPAVTLKEFNSNTMGSKIVQRLDLLDVYNFIDGKWLNYEYPYRVDWFQDDEGVLNTHREWALLKDKVSEGDSWDYIKGDDYEEWEDIKNDIKELEAYDAWTGGNYKNELGFVKKWRYLNKELIKWGWKIPHGIVLVTNEERDKYYMIEGNLRFLISLKSFTIQKHYSKVPVYIVLDDGTYSEELKACSFPRKKSEIWEFTERNK